MDKANIADDWHLRAFKFDSSDSTFYPNEPKPNHAIARDQMCLTLVPGSMDEEPPIETLSTVSNCIIKVLDGKATGRRADAYHGRLINRKSVDYSHLRSWIEDCTNDHAGCGLPSRIETSNTTKDLKVIDCLNSAVIPFSGGDFVALSYCIGPRPKSRSTVPRGKGSFGAFPRVVSDAIRCTLGLGYRYLWVDALCKLMSRMCRLSETLKFSSSTRYRPR